MRNLITLKELRLNMEKYAEGTRRGESFLVIKRSKPLFKITPIGDEEGWEEVVDFTKIKKGGINIKEILRRL